MALAGAGRPAEQQMKMVQATVSVQRIVEDEKRVRLNPRDSYLLSYREFVAYFAALDFITPHNLIIGAHFTYGWMPTILTMRPHDDRHLAAAAELLSRVKRGEALDERGLGFLCAIVNNSVVGTSKLLHFVNPQLYAIWDSNVCRYIVGKQPYGYVVNHAGNYLAYLANCRAIVADPLFAPVHSSMNAKVGYPVSALRAVELVMYATATGPTAVKPGAATG